MDDPEDRASLHDAAEEIFELTRASWIAREGQRGRKGQPDLTETEFLSLDWLVRSDPASMTVGEIQQRIHVRRAQMSRIIRALESKGGKPLIRCRINAKDKRRIDVTLTEAGKRSHAAFRDARLTSTIDMVAHLSPRDRVELMRILRVIRTYISNKLSDNELPKATE
jgi:DNA-binding MarR family transcriptional regulator